MSFYDPVPVLNVDQEFLRLQLASERVLSDRMWSPDSKNTKLASTKHWGLDDSSWIITHFRAGGHSIPESMSRVIGLRIPAFDYGV